MGKEDMGWELGGGVEAEVCYLKKAKDGLFFIDGPPPDLAACAFRTSRTTCGFAARVTSSTTSTSSSPSLAFPQ